MAGNPVEMKRVPHEWPPGVTSGPQVRLSNADKVLYPATGTTKEDVFGYYTSIAEVMVPHIAGRAVTRKRWPNGVEEPSFFEKQLAESAPDWLHRESVVHRSGTTTYPVIDDSVGLAWIAQQAALEVHVPQWRFVDGKPGPATRLVFDLDPGEGVTMSQLADVARTIRDLFTDIGLTTYPVTSGSKGIHLYVPLDKPVSSQGAVTLARRVAQQLEQATPKLVTSTMTKKLRAGKVFVDWKEQFVRHPGTSRQAAALRPAAGARRRAGQLGGAEESARDARGESSCGTYRGPPAGVSDVRGDDPEG
jgi:bifunctional non-homologous end joining protein LigD